MGPFAAGQVWKYNTRDGEEASRVIVCKVESDPKLGEIVHIHVNGLRLKSKHAPGGFVDQVGHMPYDAAALKENVTDLESVGAPLPGFEGGYEEWRNAVDRGKAGVWTLSIAKAITAMESILNQQAAAVEWESQMHDTSHARRPDTVGASGIGRSDVGGERRLVSIPRRCWRS